MKMLIAYPLDSTTIEAGLGDIIDYRPEVLQSSEALQHALLKSKANILVVGNNQVPREVLRSWREANPDKPLAVIRRGSSLSAIDTITAKMLHIDVLNTPGVNSPYVADYVCKNLPLKEGKKGKVAVIGVGKVGYYVAMEALNQGHEVVLYSPSLIQDAARDVRLKELGLYSCACAKTLEEAFEGADYICVSAALTKDAPHPSKGMIREEHIRSLAEGARLVSISEPEVFAKDGFDALVYAAKNKKLTALLDSSPRYMQAIRTAYPDLPEDIVLASEAMHDTACQKAMDKAALAVAEAWHIQDSLMPEVERLLQERQKVRPEKQESVAIVGAGILGLLTAYYLEKEGLDITILDMAEDPRLEPEWSTLGATHTANARHISATETAPHANATRKNILMKEIAAGGWRLKPLESFDEEEKKWAEDFNALTGVGWLHGIYTDDVIHINKEGLKLWHMLIAEDPDLFAGVGIKRTVVRIFMDEASMKKGLELQTRAGTILKVMDKNALAEQFPTLRSACHQGNIVGGIEVEGFCINVKDFARRLLEYLEKTKHVTFRWRNRAERMHFDDKGKVDYLETKAGILRTDHYVISPGAGATQGILKGTKSDKQIQGVAGMWMSIPNPGIDFALKIHAPEPLGVVNCTPDGSLMMIGGGMGYAGKDRPGLESPYIQEFFRQLEALIEKLFPEKYTKAKEAGTLNKRVCVRPMTPHGLGLMEISDAVDYGRAIVVGGNNMAGFTQAPVMANAVKDILKGKDNPVYKLYHPERFNAPEKVI